MSCCHRLKLAANSPQMFPVGAAAFKRAVGFLPPTDLDLAPGNKVVKTPAPVADVFN